MAITKIPEFIFKHVDQADRPSATAAEMKANLDSRAKNIRDTFNDTNVIELTEGAYNYAASTAGTDAYAITLTYFAAYTTGATVKFKADVANTGACTLNVNSLGAKALKLENGSDPTDGVIKAGAIVTVVYDGTNFQIVTTGLAVVQANLITHQAETRHIPYAVATGTANTYAVTISPAPGSYVEGLAVAVKINTDNTGASTINVNGLGAKTIKKPNGGDVAAGNLKAGSIYSLRYSVNFILQGEGGEHGTATPAEVMTGYTIGTEAGVVQGTLVLDGNAVAAEVLSGKTFYNTNPKSKLTGTMPNRGTVNITPSTANQSITQGYHSGSGVVYGDADLVAGNIKKAVNIFGVVGTFDPVFATSAGAVLVASADTEGSTTSTSYVKVKEIQLMGMKGALRVAFSQKSSTTADSYTRIYKNGSAIGTERLKNDTNYTTFTEDFSGLEVGDKIQLYAKRVTANCYYQNFRLSILELPYDILLN